MIIMMMTMIDLLSTVIGIIIMMNVENASNLSKNDTM